MKLVELARALAPGFPHQIVGVRPGEKLHEVMITNDDARTTVEYEDRYVILPSFKVWDTVVPVPEGSRPVGEDFVYASNTNTDWLDAASIRAICGL